MVTRCVCESVDGSLFISKIMELKQPGRQEADTLYARVLTIHALDTYAWHNRHSTARKLAHSLVLTITQFLLTLTARFI